MDVPSEHSIWGTFDLPARKRPLGRQSPHRVLSPGQLSGLLVALCLTRCNPEAGCAHIQVACSSPGDLLKHSNCLNILCILERSTLWCVPSWVCVPNQMPAQPLPLWALSSVSLLWDAVASPLQAYLRLRVTQEEQNRNAGWAWKWKVSSPFPTSRSASIILN